MVDIDLSCKNCKKINEFTTLLYKKKVNAGKYNIKVSINAENATCGSFLVLNDIDSTKETIADYFIGKNKLNIEDEVKIITLDEYIYFIKKGNYSGKANIDIELLEKPSITSNNIKQYKLTIGQSKKILVGEIKEPGEIYLFMHNNDKSKMYSVTLINAGNKYKFMVGNELTIKVFKVNPGEIIIDIPPYVNLSEWSPHVITWGIGWIVFENKKEKEIIKPVIPKHSIGNCDISVEYLNIDVKSDNRTIYSINSPGTFYIRMPIELNISMYLHNKNASYCNYKIELCDNNKIVRTTNREIKIDDMVNTSYLVTENSEITIKIIYGNKTKTLGPFIFRNMHGPGMIHRVKAKILDIILKLKNI